MTNTTTTEPTTSHMSDGDQDAIRDLRTEDAWWAWHDADASRWSPGEDPTEATADAEARCSAWLRGESDDGPERD